MNRKETHSFTKNNQKNIAKALYVVHISLLRHMKML